uniref:Intraflagellar transport protein 56 n=1 Tax=Pavo cristatus TaxID=9049 RepID=A0A8C9EPB3_PAVCR
MMLSRAKPAVGSAPPQGDRRKKKGKKVPQLEELLAGRDFTGTARGINGPGEDADLWIGYSAFHLGDYKRALEEYEALTKQPSCNPDVWVNLACTYFFLGMYTQAEQAALKAPKSRLQNRLLFHLAHKVQCLFFTRALLCFHFNLVIYRREDYNIQLSICCFYLQVVFRGGEGALQVLPPLVDVIPEARLNLVIYYLRQDDVQEAYNLIKDLEPTAPQEYILKGVVNAALGQEMDSRDHLKIAQQFFQLVGESASECDTIPGRQCMASCFFLLRQFANVLIYLNSVKSYFYNDDTFNFNYAQAKASMGLFSEAEEVFLLIQSEKIKNDFVYLSWLARCYIMNKKPQLAWKLYLKMETSGESFNLLQLIANDCYKMRQFYYAAKAFDVLERLDSNPEYWEGKRGACVGVFQMILAGREAKETLREVLHLLRSTGNSQVEYIIRIMKKWAKENRVPV